VAGGYDIEAAVQGNTVEGVSLRQPTHRAGRSRSLRPRRGDVEAVFISEVDVEEIGSPVLRESTGCLARAVRVVTVVTDPEPEVHARGAVPEVEEHVPQRQ